MERIEQKQIENKPAIIVEGLRNATKLNILRIWFILWTLSGVVVFSQFFSGLSRENKMFLAIWMAFWAYFEYKASILLGWRKSGKEVITFFEDRITIKREMNGRGLDQPYLLNRIKNIRLVDFNDPKTKARVQPLFWAMGAETVLFDYDGKQVGIGLQLSKEDANKLLKLLKHKLKGI